MSVFSTVPRHKVRKSVFDLSHERKFTGSMGVLYPILVEDCIPGDIFNIGVKMAIRFHQPLIAPLLHNVTARVEYFFVPYRLLWHHDKAWCGRQEAGLNFDGTNPDLFSDYTRSISRSCTGSFEEFMTGNPLGAGNVKSRVITPPRSWLLSRDEYNPARLSGGSADFLYGVIGAKLTGGGITGMSDLPLAWPELAYAFVWNEYYRDETLQVMRFTPDSEQTPLSSDVIDIAPPPDRFLFRRNWTKDYFTSALPFQQRGTPPALPIAGDLMRSVFSIPGNSRLGMDVIEDSATSSQVWADNRNGSVSYVNVNTASMMSAGEFGYLRTRLVPDGSVFSDLLSANNSIEGSVNFTMADLRASAQAQIFLESMARAGMRYGEVLKEQFGIKDHDSRLDRPEFISSVRIPIVYSEVLNTSPGGTVPGSGETVFQGNMAGHGLGVGSQFCCKYRIPEHGIIIGLFSMTPDPAYQQGVERMWLRDAREDFYFPEFANLAEQPVYEQELLCLGTDIAASYGGNRTVFGYQGRYDEYRQRRSTVHGSMRDTLDFWHLSRQFSSDPASRPQLNDAFISCQPRTDIYPVPSEYGFICTVGNTIRAIRPLPSKADPGRLDHFV